MTRGLFSDTIEEDKMGYIVGSKPYFIEKLGLKEQKPKFKISKNWEPNYVGLCPFHKEKTPSFAVNFRNNIYFCFGCHRRGKIEHLEQEIEDRAVFECIESGVNGLDSPEEFNINFVRDGNKYTDVYIVHKNFDSEPQNHWRDLYYMTSPIYYGHFLEKYFNTRDRFTESAKRKFDRMFIVATRVVCRRPTIKETKCFNMSDLETVLEDAQQN